MGDVFDETGAERSGAASRTRSPSGDALLQANPQPGRPSPGAPTAVPLDLMLADGLRYRMRINAFKALGTAIVMIVVCVYIFSGVHVPLPSWVYLLIVAYILLVPSVFVGIILQEWRDLRGATCLQVAGSLRVQRAWNGTRLRVGQSSLAVAGEARRSVRGRAMGRVAYTKRSREILEIRDMDGEIVYRLPVSRDY
ncbi:MAG: hypothetical protein LC793_00780 [Thermomicrobia bacterium]|nr:hypothetical protein [Thermomicrobia bacterium]MCA1724485.1 hypothetical protein [Thermomicrobia bacterium]